MLMEEHRRAQMVVLGEITEIEFGSRLVTRNHPIRLSLSQQLMLVELGSQAPVHHAWSSRFHSASWRQSVQGLRNGIGQSIESRMRERRRRGRRLGKRLEKLKAGRSRKTAR